MNRFDKYIADYLFENKEASLEKIGTVKLPPNFSAEDESSSLLFTVGKKITTTESLISFIAEREKKNRFLIASDLESHLAQVREYINIGKTYEIPNIGLIKSNKAGVYEYLPYSAVNKSIRITPQQQTTHAPHKGSNRSFVQIITLLIVLAILAGLGYEAYQFFIKKQPENYTVTNAATDTSVAPNKDTTQKDSLLQSQPKTLAPTDSIKVRYIFETTASGLRAKTRTTQLTGFGSNAGYDSFMLKNTRYYSLYILRNTIVSDTARIRDSIGKFLQKDIKIELEQK